MRWTVPALTLLLGCTGTQAPAGNPPTGEENPAALAVGRASVVTGSAVTTAATEPTPPAEEPPPGEDERGGPPYPIVLAHGFFGFEAFAGADFATYFYGVADHLREVGEREVFTPAVDPFNDSERRGAQLLGHVERIVRETGRRKVVIVAHSQGGLDARYVASVRPDLVAAVVTISTPHRGTPIADDVLDLVDRRLLRPLVDAVAHIFGRPLYDAADVDTSLVAALRQLSSAGAARFAERYPDGAGVRYYSIAGRSDRHPGGDDCRAEGPLPGFMVPWAEDLDPVDPLFSLTESLLDGDGDVPNDGMVRVRDARYGRFLGCIPADHMDEVGHLFGDAPGGDNRFDHLAFYEGLVRWLREHGF